MLSHSLVKASLGLQPRPDVLHEVPLRFVPEVQARYAQPVELTCLNLEPLGDLLARQDCAKRVVTPLL